MLDTALYLQEQMQQQQQQPARIVLTGAMRPERFSNSDAPVNLGMALAAVQLTPVIEKRDTPVYVCMHGIVKPVSEMTRDATTGRFL